MSNSTHLKRRSRRSPEQWSVIVDNWRASGLSAEDYAEQHDLGVHSLWRWSRRAGKAPARPPEPKISRTAAPRFLTVEVAGPRRPTESEAAAAGTIEIAWPGGAVLRLSGDVNQGALVAVMQALVEVTSC